MSATRTARQITAHSGCATPTARPASRYSGAELASTIERSIALLLRPLHPVEVARVERIAVLAAAELGRRALADAQASEDRNARVRRGRDHDDDEQEVVDD